MTLSPADRARNAVQKIAGAWDMVGFSISMKDDAEKILAAEFQEVIEEGAKVAENSSPRHTECGNRIAAALRQRGGGV